MQAAESYIVAANYGEDYVCGGLPMAKKSTQKIQDAHEAIRPTDITPIAGSW